MAIFAPPPPNPTNADLADVLLQLHNCIEEGKVFYTTGLKEAKLERQSLRSGQLNMARRIKAVEGSVNELTDGVVKNTKILNEFTGLFENIRKTIRRSAGSIVLSLITAFIIGIATLLWNNVSKADLNAKTHDRFTAQDAQTMKTDLETQIRATK